MNATLLQREAIAWDTDDDTDLLLGDLDREAQATLGYGRLLKERTKSRRRMSLQRTLVDLDIRPFTPQSVEAYKRSCARTANRRLAESALLASGFGMLLCCCALPVLVFSALLSFADVAFYAAAVFLTGAAGALACGLFNSQYARERTWKMQELSSYAEPIPEFALQTAVEVKKAHPEVEFYVCKLEENQIVVDPFLVMRTFDDDERRDYYLEVWNESSFCGRREA